MTAYEILTSSADTLTSQEISAEAQVKILLRLIHYMEAETDENLKTKLFLIGMPLELEGKNLDTLNFMPAKLHKITVLNEGEYPFIISTGGESLAEGEFQELAKAINETRLHGGYYQMLILPL